MLFFHDTVKFTSINLRRDMSFIFKACLLSLAKILRCQVMSYNFIAIYLLIFIVGWILTQELFYFFSVWSKAFEQLANLTVHKDISVLAAHSVQKYLKLNDRICYFDEGVLYCFSSGMFGQKALLVVLLHWNVRILWSVFLLKIDTNPLSYF